MRKKAFAKAPLDIDIVVTCADGFSDGLCQPASRTGGMSYETGTRDSSTCRACQSREGGAPAVIGNQEVLTEGYLPDSKSASKGYAGASIAQA